jgi:DNA modification methylase
VSITILTGDALEQLRTLPDASVHCCVTSPPYYGLRDYGMAGQIGLEDTPDAFVARLVEVFREVRRVLRNDGTCWLNLGDSYVSVGNGTQGANGEMATRRVSQVRDRKAIHSTIERPPSVPGLAAKNLIGIPWRVAFALQSDGWYLRQDIIWAKPNPMPESVTDRCTKSHEYVFLLAKSSVYHYDAKAIAEPLARPDEADRKTPAKFGGADKHVEAGKQSRLHSGNEYKGTEDGTRNRRSVWTIGLQPFWRAMLAASPQQGEKL